MFSHWSEIFKVCLLAHSGNKTHESASRFCSKWGLACRIPFPHHSDRCSITETSGGGEGGGGGAGSLRNSGVVNQEPALPIRINRFFMM